jgi:D-amino peptidase
MRIYISVDMEGLAGVAHSRQTVFGMDATDRVDYDRSRGLMAGETNAAIEGAVAAGADEVIVNDSHWQMRNLRAEDLNSIARLVVGDKPYSMTQGIGGIDDPEYDAAVFVGYHAGAGHPMGVIGHTYAGRLLASVRINGVAHNEAGINALRLGQHGVPVALVSGDDALAGEIEELLPWAERVVVKRALGQYVAESLSPERARDAIRDGVRRALGRLGEMRLYRLDAPLTCEIDFHQPVMAAYAAMVPGVSRSGPRMVAFEAPDPEQLYRLFVSLVRLAAVPGS